MEWLLTPAPRIRTALLHATFRVIDMTMQPKSTDCSAAEFVFLELVHHHGSTTSHSSTEKCMQRCSHPSERHIIKKGQGERPVGQMTSKNCPTRPKFLSQTIMETQVLDLIQLPPVRRAETVDTDDSPARGISTGWQEWSVSVSSDLSAPMVRRRTLLETR